MPKLTWLHLSDLHAAPNKTGWDSRHITSTLCDDLRVLGIRPDLLFFTGDLAFGNISNKEGDTLQSQYVVADAFLDSVRNAFSPPLERRNTFIVPGNHDINRSDVDESQREWLDSPRRTLDDINRLFRDTTQFGKRMFERLADFRDFLASNDYSHLLTDAQGRSIFADIREVNGIRVGIAGLNSAWSAYGGDDDKARLWCAGRMQAELLLPRLQDADIRIALMHHPVNWFKPEEDPSFGHLLSAEFRFLLTGHEHTEWVTSEAATRHSKIAAGACYNSSQLRNGYNIVELDLGSGMAKVHLREYREAGRGWVACNINKLAPRGIWTIQDALPVPRASRKPKTPRANQAARSRALYEKSFRDAVVIKFDYVELFGADIHHESRNQSLSVAYVSLTMTTDAEESEGGVGGAGSDEDADVPKGPLPAERVFDVLSESKRCFILRGVAGGGKSTVLRWVAIEAARGDDLDTAGSESDGLVDRSRWRDRIPFLIRLRDLADGRLPRPSEFPRLIAKELADPPQGWVESVFADGRALLLLDGVDEVPLRDRDILSRDIRNLLQIYPKVYCVVTTRPGAVPSEWLSGIDAWEARIEELSPKDREALIDNWFAAVASQRRVARANENLPRLAAQLKGELRDTPGIARLAKYPLLCAMICALYRDRNQRLPDTQVALCEDLSKVLLHRRERETPEMQLLHLTPAYRQLDYEQKKFLVATLAKAMVEGGVSAMPRVAAEQLVQNAVERFPAHKKSFEPGELLQALIERSGLLRPMGADGVEFVHNTLKEYLAATQFVEQADFSRLVRNCLDDAWQPVILFAVALPKPKFGSELLSALLRKRASMRRLATKAASSKRSRVARVAIRSLEFLIVRCKAAAFRLKVSIDRVVERIAGGLFPPNTMADSETLASMGEAVLPHIDAQMNDRRLGARQRAACIRVLRLVGGDKAAERLAKLRVPEGRAVMMETIDACAELGIKLTNVADVVDLRGLAISSVSPLPLEHLMVLDVSDTNVTDVDELRGGGGLRELMMSGTGVRSISPLAACRELRYLDCGETRVMDFDVLVNLRSLEALRLADVSFVPFRTRRWAKAYHSDDLFRELYQSAREMWATVATHSTMMIRAKMGHPLHQRRQYEEYLFAVRALGQESGNGLQMEHELRRLFDGIRSIGVAKASRELEKLRELMHRVGIGDAAGRLSEGVSSCVRLRLLDVSGVLGLEANVFRGLQKLEYLSVANSWIDSSECFARLENLRWLDVSGCPLADVEAFAGLSKLEVLDLSWTGILDLSVLARMRSLRVIFALGVERFPLEKLMKGSSVQRVVLRRTPELVELLRAHEKRPLPFRLDLVP